MANESGPSPDPEKGEVILNSDDQLVLAKAFSLTVKQMEKAKVPVPEKYVTITRFADSPDEPRTIAGYAVSLEEAGRVLSSYVDALAVVKSLREANALPDGVVAVVPSASDEEYDRAIMLTGRFLAESLTTSR